jgi:hypothetical protein
MGCNCGKNRTVTVRYRLTMPDGKASIHGTRRSAELANARKGGEGTITKVA